MFLHIDEETLRSLQSFETVEAMNERIKFYKQKDALSQADRLILDTISQYACKYRGVCYLSKGKIAIAAGFKSRRTAIRACHRIEALGMIKQFETRRKVGDKRRSSNIIVIQNGLSQGEVTLASHKEEALEQAPVKAKQYDTFIETELASKNGLKAVIPELIYDAFAPFFNAKELYDIYGILLRAKAKVRATFMIEDYAEEYVLHFQNVIRLYKWGKVRNLKNYLYVTWCNLTVGLSRRFAMEKGLVNEVYRYDYLGDGDRESHEEVAFG